MKRGYNQLLKGLLEKIANNCELTDYDIKVIYEYINNNSAISENDLILLNAAQKQILNKRSIRNEGMSASSPISSS